MHLPPARLVSGMPEAQGLAYWNQQRGWDGFENKTLRMIMVRPWMTEVDIVQGKEAEQEEAMMLRK